MPFNVSCDRRCYQFIYRLSGAHTSADFGRADARGGEAQPHEPAFRGHSDPGTRSGDDGKGYQARDFPPLSPPPEPFGHVAADDQEELSARVTAAQGAKGVNGVGRPPTANFDRGDRHTANSAEGEPGHPESVAGGGQFVGVFKGCMPGRDDEHFVQAKLPESSSRDADMSAVDGVEAAAEDAKFHSPVRAGLFGIIFRTAV